MDIRLNLINRSNDINHTRYVLFQKNLATDYGELAYAWKVVRNLGYGDHHPFVYSTDVKVSAEDAWGNFTPHIAASPGQAFQMTRTPSGDRLIAAGCAASTTEIDIRNSLLQGSINASVYRSGSLLARKTAVAPGQEAVFDFKPTLFIGAVSQVREGTAIDSAVISTTNTELSLLGIASADIVVTGGGGGVNSTAFAFNMENVVMA